MSTLLILWVSVCLCQATISRNHRSDDADFQSVMTVLQHQAATIQRQEATVQALQYQVNALLRNVSILQRQSTHATISRSHRSDDADFQSVMTVLQHQAATIQRQEATVQALQYQVNALLRNVSVLQRQSTHVSFMAQMTQHVVTIGTSSPLRFDKIITNIGGAYSPASGVFTAPFSGVYVFYAQLMKHLNDGTLHYVVVQSETEICENSLDRAPDFDKSSCLTTVHVQKGEQVFVRPTSGQMEVEGNVWCSFAGFSLFVDE